VPEEQLTSEDRRPREAVNTEFQPLAPSDALNEEEDTEIHQIGRIIVAEDQLHHMQVLQSQFKDLNLLEKCTFAFNGEELVNKF